MEAMAQLVIEQIPMLNDNYVYLVHEPGAGVTGVVDPAVAAPVLERLRARGWKLDWILSTHHHADHTGGNLELKQATGCRVAGARADETRIPGIDLKLAEGDRFKLGEAAAQVFETPGHTSGHISFWFPEAKALFCADTLFSLGCGRVFEGSHAQMWDSLCKLAALPDDTLAYCGHEYTQANARFALSVDPDNQALRARAAEVDRQRAAGQATVPTTIAAERAANPFLRAGDAAIRARLGMADASDAEVFAEIRRRKDSF
jgi:hydroxyacylglutathione hydrolase